ncbi:MAG: hypothetical protein KGO94_08995, partial [Alphaproteobacteria bacterium]|nr:hypothetical protein [Alphaproteobacteria bacterium]
MGTTAREWAIITPTYHLDYDQFALMCESMDRFVVGKWHHYVVVNATDYAMFAKFAGPRRTVLENTKILPKWLRYVGKLPRVRSGNFFFSWRTGFFFGWHMQQLVKIAMAYYIKQDAMMLVDSDLFFIRRFNLDSMIKDGRLPFVRLGEDLNQTGAEPPPMFQHAIKLLGLSRSIPTFAYAYNIVVWDRKTVLEMCAFLEKKYNKHWIATLSGLQTISEGSLYGLFVDYVLADKNRFAHENYYLTKTVHGDHAIHGAELEEFVSNIEGHAVALGFQSS